MKKSRSSEITNVRTVEDLCESVRWSLEVDPVLRWTVPDDTGFGPIERLDLHLDGQKFPFTPVYELKPSVAGLQAFFSREQVPPPLLVAPELSAKVLQECRDLGICALDLNGRTWLRAPGLLVDRREPLPGRSFRSEQETPNIFEGKSARIVRCLLTDRERLWTQSEIVPRIGVSSGLVSRTTQELIGQGLLEKTSARQFRLRDPQALLEAWADEDRLVKRARTTLYAGFAGSPLELARHVQEWAHREAVPLAFTQWVAAWLRHPFTEPVVCSAYVKRLPTPAELEALGLRQVTEGGKLWLHVPDDEGLLQETQQHAGFTLTTDAQIYLDLQRTGLRGPDAAAALSEWEGFCRV